MVSPITTSVLVGLGVMASHGAAHYLAGDPEDFDEAGVNTAGLTVGIAGMVATYIVLSAGGLA